MLCAQRVDRFSDDAVVLSTVDYGDTHRIAALFTRTHGRLGAFAAGARASRRRFAGALEPGTLLRCRLVARRGDTVRLDGVDVLDSFHRVRGELSRIARMLYALELCRELTREREVHAGLFDALVDFLRRLDGGAAGPTALLELELSALHHAGLRPCFSPCAACGGALHERPRFSPQAGGAVCEACALRLPGAAPLAPELVAALAGLQAGARAPLPHDVRQRGRELLSSFIGYHLGRRLNSASFLEHVGAG